MYCILGKGFSIFLKEGKSRWIRLRLYLTAKKLSEVYNRLRVLFTSIFIKKSS